MPCRVSKTQDWSRRINHEAKYHKEKCFITLTFKEECLPSNKSLDKTVFQNFMKRLRKETDIKLKFYGCGEYGELDQRPHYHLILFGWKPGDEIISKIWPFGFVSVKEYLGETTGNYVAGYVQKKLYGDDAIEYIKRGVIPPFSLMSKGLGERYCLDNAYRLKTEKCEYNGINPVALPRYYRKKLDITFEDFEMLAEEKQQEVYSQWSKRLGFDPDAECMTAEQWMAINGAIKKSRIARSHECRKNAEIARWRQRL